MRDKYCNNCERLLSINAELQAKLTAAEAELEQMRSERDQALVDETENAKLRAALEDISKRIAKPISMTDAIMQLSEVEHIADEALAGK